MQSITTNFLCSDLSHGDHLLPQVIFIFANRAIPPLDCLVLTHHDIFGNLIK